MPILINSMKLLKNIERLNNYESAKRTGQIVDFDLEKIGNAIKKPLIVNKLNTIQQL